jgi:heme exporter protein C
MPLAKKLAPPFLIASIALLFTGLYVAFFLAPTDFQQGEAYRIIFIHVPAAWMSMILYIAIGFWSVVGLTLKSRLSFIYAQAIAPTGALFTLLALITGSLWGKPMWGTWWVWDARLTSELILLFLYVGFMLLHDAFEDQTRSDRTSAVFAVVGVINIPVIYYSVTWWNTLHQGASISLTRAPSMALTMILGLIITALSFWSYSIGITLMRAQRLINKRTSISQDLTEEQIA